MYSLKLLSEAPDRYPDAVLEGIDRMLEMARIGDEGSSPEPKIDSVRVGTTVATNALLERKGVPTALVVTAGFGDSLEIGYQNRPKLFALEIERPAPLYREVLEVDERVGDSGEVIRPLDEEALREGYSRLIERGISAVAIVFMHGFRYTEHERRAAEIARASGFQQVSVSHEVSSLRKLVVRGSTTVLDAYLSPGLKRYVDRLERALPGVRLSFMQSRGGLVDAGRFFAKDSLLSGPAGGVVGMVAAARQAGVSRAVGFDMGGTSTDVSIFDGAFERLDELELAGVRLRIPSLAVHTVAAGGGSVVRYDAGRLTVGPESAGADPGPASYRRGGPLTVTDANVQLGRLQPDLFPRVFGPDADRSLDREAVGSGFEQLLRVVEGDDGSSDATDASEKDAVPAADALAGGVVEIAVARMAAAIERITIGRGLDVSEFALISFGGAGGQHACAVATVLGIETIIVPPVAGLLSAQGIALSERRVRREEVVESELAEVLVEELEARFLALEEVAVLRLQEEEPSATDPKLERSAALSLQGSDTQLQVAWSDASSMRRDFLSSHRQLFGFVDESRPILVETIAVEAVAPGARSETREESGAAGLAHAQSGTTEEPAAQSTSAETRPVWFAGSRVAAPFFERDDLREGEVVVGPAVIVEADATTVVGPGWVATLEPSRSLRLEHRSPESSVVRRSIDVNRADPILLEVFNHRFMEIAEQMGAVLERTAQSVNIKERLDFSCAVFDAAGDLVANAPHMPVHLGSMGESVRAVLQREGAIRPGDVFALNDPYTGGTHLPDITVVTPMFLGAEAEPQFWVASRGHHADVGGILPGSMPPASRSIEEEGVVLRDLRVVAGGEFREADVRAALLATRWPPRDVEQNLGDLKAQIAANERGLQGLSSALESFGRAAVVGYMKHVQDNAEEAVRRALSRLDSGSFALDLDNGQRIEVAISIDRESRSARVDFAGTSKQQANNFNAPVAVCRAAVLYVFRTLVERDIPLNAGCLRPLQIVVPAGSMLSPQHPAAVVAGNVETSQCVTDALFGALGVLSAAQGTMNNFTFGDDRLQYYETICGGAGASPKADGASAVHTHMTNSRLTDPEVLEHRFPVRLEAFSIRRGSGGAGRYRGGDGVVRRVRFLTPLSASILSNRRRVPPFGLSGGLAGALGINAVERADGSRVELGSTATVDVAAGDLFVIETPGGGGYGEPE